MTTADTHTFKVGDRVLHQGKPATIYAHSHTTGAYWVSDPAGTPLHRVDRDKRTVDESAPGDTLGLWAAPHNLTPLTEPQNGPQSDAQPVNGQSLQTAEIQALKAQIQAMQDDLATIGEHLKRTAERHEWCGEYEEHLSRLVDDLSEHSAKTLHDAARRVQTYKVSRTLTHTIEACDAAQAERIANDRYGQADWTAEEAE